MSHDDQEEDKNKVIKVDPAGRDTLIQPAIVVHCKAGKGRTGTMICALLVFLNLFDNHMQAITHYNRQRAANEKALTIASQYRYVKFMTGFMHHKLADEGGLLKEEENETWLWKALQKYNRDWDAAIKSWRDSLDDLYK